MIRLLNMRGAARTQWLNSRLWERARGGGVVSYCFVSKFVIFNFANTHNHHNTCIHAMICDSHYNVQLQMANSYLYLVLIFLQNENT